MPDLLRMKGKCLCLIGSEILGLHLSSSETMIQLGIHPPRPLLSPCDCFTGHGSCSCGRCVCERGWFGKLCQHPRKCNMTEEQSKSLCESADGILCSGKGEYLCRSLDQVPVLTHGGYRSTYNHLFQTSRCLHVNHTVLCLCLT